MSYSVKWVQFAVISNAWVLWNKNGSTYIFFLIGKEKYH